MSGISRPKNLRALGLFDKNKKAFRENINKVNIPVSLSGHTEALTFKATVELLREISKLPADTDRNDKQIGFNTESGNLYLGSLKQALKGWRNEGFIEFTDAAYKGSTITVRPDRRAKLKDLLNALKLTSGTDDKLEIYTIDTSKLRPISEWHKTQLDNSFADPSTFYEGVHNFISAGFSHFAEITKVTVEAIGAGVKNLRNFAQNIRSFGLSHLTQGDMVYNRNLQTVLRNPGKALKDANLKSPNQEAKEKREAEATVQREINTKIQEKRQDPNAARVRANLMKAAAIKAPEAADAVKAAEVVAKEAQTKADAAKVAADDAAKAKVVADAAKTAADAAKTAADDAAKAVKNAAKKKEDAAKEAQTKADAAKEAQTKADEAAAAIAEVTADVAKVAADAAKAAADAAKKKEDTAKEAQMKADAAKAAADAAAKKKEDTAKEATDTAKEATDTAKAAMDTAKAAMDTAKAAVMKMVAAKAAMAAYMAKVPADAAKEVSNEAKEVSDAAAKIAADPNAAEAAQAKADAAQAAADKAAKEAAKAADAAADAAKITEEAAKIAANPEAAKAMASHMALLAAQARLDAECAEAKARLDAECAEAKAAYDTDENPENYQACLEAYNRERQGPVQLPGEAWFLATQTAKEGISDCFLTLTCNNSANAMSIRHLLFSDLEKEDPKNSVLREALNNEIFIEILKDPSNEKVSDGLEKDSPTAIFIQVLRDDDPDTRHRIKKVIEKLFAFAKDTENKITLSEKKITTWNAIAGKYGFNDKDLLPAFAKPMPRVFSCWGKKTKAERQGTSGGTGGGTPEMILNPFFKNPATGTGGGASVEQAYDTLTNAIEANKDKDTVSEDFETALHKFITHATGAPAEQLNELIQNENFIGILEKNKIDQNNFQLLYGALNKKDVTFTPETAKQWLNIHQKGGYNASALLFIPMVKEIPGGKLIAEHLEAAGADALQRHLTFSLTGEERTKYISALKIAYTDQDSSIRKLPEGFSKGVYIPVRNGHNGSNEALALVGLGTGNKTKIRLYDTHGSEKAGHKDYTPKAGNNQTVNDVISAIVNHNYEPYSVQPTTYLPTDLENNFQQSSIYGNVKAQAENTCAGSCVVDAILDVNEELGKTSREKFLGKESSATGGGNPLKNKSGLLPTKVPPKKPEQKANVTPSITPAKGAAEDSAKTKSSKRHINLQNFREWWKGEPRQKITPEPTTAAPPVSTEPKNKEKVATTGKRMGGRFKGFIHKLSHWQQGNREQESDTRSPIEKTSATTTTATPVTAVPFPPSSAPPKDTRKLAVSFVKLPYHIDVLQDLVEEMPERNMLVIQDLYKQFPRNASIERFQTLDIAVMPDVKFLLETIENIGSQYKDLTNFPEVLRSDIENTVSATSELARLLNQCLEKTAKQNKLTATKKILPTYPEIHSEEIKRGNQEIIKILQNIGIQCLNVFTQTNHLKESINNFCQTLDIADELDIYFDEACRELLPEAVKMILPKLKKINGLADKIKDIAGMQKTEEDPKRKEDLHELIAKKRLFLYNTLRHIRYQNVPAIISNITDSDIPKNIEKYLGVLDSYKKSIFSGDISQTMLELKETANLAIQNVTKLINEKDNDN